VITECGECGGKVSTQATTCPHCGAPVRRAGSSTPAPVARSASDDTAAPAARDVPWRRIVLLLSALLIVIAAAWVFMPAAKRQAATHAVGGLARTEQTITDQTYEVAPGTYHVLSMTLHREGKVTLSLAVTEGAAVDLFLMDDADRREFQDAMAKAPAGAFHHQAALSRESVREHAESAVLPPGAWHFVIRSTEAAPLGAAGKPARVRVKLSVQG